MPRKRRTKATSRAKPKAPAGDEGADLSIEEKKQKLKLFLKDFDNEVQARIAMIRKQAKHICDSVNGVYSLELMKLPKNIRNMKRSEFLQAGGSVSQVHMKATDEIVDSITSTMSIEIERTSEKPRRIVSRTAIACDTITEEEESSQDEAPLTKTTTKKGRKVRVKKTTAILADNTNMPPPSTRRTVKREFKTPGMPGRASRAGWETPQITPKFDPRLPQTPFVRQSKPGERLISLAGSPVITDVTQAASNSAVSCFVVPLNDGRALTVTADMDVDDIDVQDIDAGLQKTIGILMQKVNCMFRLPVSKKT